MMRPAPDTPFGMNTPLGPLAWALDEAGRCTRLVLGAQCGFPMPEPRRDDPVIAWLARYFARRFPDTPPPLAPPASRFQARLRIALQAIPPGRTCTYGELAMRLGSSPRAVGQALRVNPVPLLVPCHRVIAAKGMGGFSAGITWKQHLLAFESENKPHGSSE